LPFSELQLASLTLSPFIVTGGDFMMATISLNGVARAGGQPVVLRSSTPVAQPVPLVMIPERQASIQTVVNTIPVTVTQSGTIRAEALGSVQTADFEVDPTIQAQLSGVAVAPTSLLGGRPISGTVTLAGPAPSSGVRVLLSSDSPAVR